MTQTLSLRGLLVAVGTLLIGMLAAMIIQSGSRSDWSVISDANAAQEGGGKGGGAHGGGFKGGGAQSGGAQSGGPAAGSGGQGGRGTGGAVESKIFRAPAAAEDSDRPPWAGVKGGKAGGGGMPPGAGTMKGDLFGDMVVLLRDANGEPILNDAGLVQVIAYIYDASGDLVPLTDAEGNLVVIPYNAEGDLETTMVVNGVTYEVYGAEVELGRLSVSRSPTKVLDHALSEALAKLTADGAAVTVDATGRLLVDGVAIDSPLENLALYDVYMSTGEIPGVTLPDGFNPAALLAAASDKAGAISVDTVVYINSILGINNLNAGTYYDFSSVEYDREATWDGVTVSVLVLQPDGVTYKVEDVNVYTTLFGGTTWTDPTATGGADDFAAAANDYLAVIEFVHDNAVR